MLVTPYYVRNLHGRVIDNAREVVRWHAVRLHNNEIPDHAVVEGDAPSYEVIHFRYAFVGRPKSEDKSPAFSLEPSHLIVCQVHTTPIIDSNKFYMYLTHQPIMLSILVRIKNIDIKPITVFTLLFWATFFISLLLSIFITKAKNILTNFFKRETYGY